VGIVRLLLEIKEVVEKKVIEYTACGRIW